MTEEKAELPPEVGQVESKIKLGNGGQLVVNNRAYRRAWRNRAMMEGRPKKFYTTKQFHTRIRNGKTTKVCKNTYK